ncbi:autotransporter domain-containing protein [Phyllobacterium sp. A18/5-2]|uniref:autotransporter outer membrane beta-barrel domain-containing protein n=1 Tax=Phyllobacterium sp. A18/5-2 TaxID=2978392 RepID=UPI0013AFE228|nr:autotransporter domain-containing protein [Phyllobacterium sp. A18/5-2]UXN63233.1 autotransporter domain-containing protein [Phyllobacterium sp. A18/5-2]
MSEIHHGGGFDVVSVPVTRSLADKINRGIWKKYLLLILLTIGLAEVRDNAIAQEVVVSGDVLTDPDAGVGVKPNPWNAGYVLYVGASQQGALSISNGGIVFLGTDNPTGSFKHSRIGVFSGSVGDVIVTGEGSTFNFGNLLVVGESGTGSLTIENGARVVNDGIAIDGSVPRSAIGLSPGGIGVVRVAGTDSFWAPGERLLVGQGGTGTLGIAAGGTVQSSVAVAIGRLAGGDGTVTVQGTDALLDTGQNLFVGLGGTGSMTVANGGSVRSAGITEIGGGEGLASQSILPGAGTGTVVVTGSGSILAAGDVLNVGSRGNGTLTVGEGAVVSSGSIGIALQQAANGTINLEGGTLQADTIAFGQGTGAINFNHNQISYVFSPGMSGAGTLNMASGRTILTGNSGGFTGSTHVMGGQLIVNGTLGGVIDIGAGTLLGGNGTLGSTAIGDGGVLSPGNSIGTISVNGDLTSNQGSVYRVEVDPAGSNDKTLVSGVAALAGHVDVIASTGKWRFQTDYTILSAMGGLNGTRFTDVSSNLQFLDPTLTYDPNNVMLTLRRNNIAISDLAETPNQRNAAQSIDDFIANNPAGDHPLVQNMLGLDAATAPLTIAQLPGEIHVSITSVLLDDSRFIRDAENNRLRAAFGGVAAPAIPILAYGPAGTEPDAVATDQFAVWGQGFGSWADWDSNDNVPGVDRSLGGLLIGGDAPIGDNGRLGILAGYSYASIDETSLDASSSIDSIHLGIYGGAEFGALSLRSGAGYTWHDISTDRLVQFTGSRERLTADYDGGTAQIFGELGYRIKAGSVDLEPFANLSYANLHLDGFAEEGGSAVLSASSSNTDITFSTLGLRASTQLPIGSMEATMRGMIGWRHAYGDITPLSRLAFTGMNAFEISGLPIARDAALLEVGFDVDLASATTFSLYYQGQVASEVQDHGVRADLTVRF